MILKSFLVEKNLSTIENYFVTLLYGENIGLKDDIKKHIKEKYKDFEQVNLHQDEVLKDDVLMNKLIMFLCSTKTRLFS